MERPAGSLEEGVAVNLDPIPVARPDIGPLERENVRKVMESGWLSQGPYVEQAEEKLRQITGRKFAICTSSGTTALIAALLGRIDLRCIKAPALTFAAVHNAINMLSAEQEGIGGVCYAESDLKSWQAQPESCPYWYGTAIVAPCYGKVEGSDRRYKKSDDSVAFTIEDCAESWGASLDWKLAGTFGDVSCVSWYANKICTSIEGGALLTDDPDLAKKLRTAINHGIAGRSYVSESVGFNGRMSDVHAAILCAQLDRMPEMIQRRRAIMDDYRSAAGPEWTFPTLAPGEVPAPWLFAGIHTDVKDVQRRADAANIEWRPFFPVPKDAGEMKETRFISENGICLPLSSTLTDAEMSRVCEVIRGN